MLSGAAVTAAERAPKQTRSSFGATKTPTEVTSSAQMAHLPVAIEPFQPASLSERVFDSAVFVLRAWRERFWLARRLRRTCKDSERACKQKHQVRARAAPG